MSRRKRVVIPGIPHHVTQRGGRRQTVFFMDKDYQIYRGLLAENAARYGVEILAYCLMTNHVHHLMIPQEEDSLRWTLQLTHKRYAEYINGRHAWTGHLWQQRFYSSPVDEDFVWITLRYIERNPVEANMVKHASDYPWSSAVAHCELGGDSLLTKREEWVKQLDKRSNWYQWLAESDAPEHVSKLRMCTSRDLPTGSERFITWLEQTFQVAVRPPKLGRPKVGKS